MSIYRKLDLRVHADEKVRNLSKPPPSGYTLWIELIVGRATGVIPGLLVVGEAALAEKLGWPLEGFRKVWHEIESQGMARADWEAQVIFLPNALKYNKPASPNVIRSWDNAWELVPECPLKMEAYREMKGAVAKMSAKSDGYVRAFAETIAPPKLAALAEEPGTEPDADRDAAPGSTAHAPPPAAAPEPEPAPPEPVPVFVPMQTVAEPIAEPAPPPFRVGVRNERRESTEAANGAAAVAELVEAVAASVEPEPLPATEPAPEPDRDRERMLDQLTTEWLDAICGRQKLSSESREELRRTWEEMIADGIRPDAILAEIRLRAPQRQRKEYVAQLWDRLGMRLGHSARSLNRVAPALAAPPAGDAEAVSDFAAFEAEFIRRAPGVGKDARFVRDWEKDMAQIGATREEMLHSIDKYVADPRRLNDKKWDGGFPRSALPVLIAYILARRKTAPSAIGTGKAVPLWSAELESQAARKHDQALLRLGKITEAEFDAREAARAKKTPFTDTG